MFASAAYLASPRHQAGAYKQVHVTTGVGAASPHGLVSMLFEGFLAALAEARGAMLAGHIEAKGRAIGRALRIVDEGLNASLNLSEGGAIAANLRNLYNYITMRLTHANLRNDAAALEECGRLIEPLRSAWSEIAHRAPA